jgi:hypothetical protein
VGARRLGLVGPRRDGHETADVESITAQDASEQLARLLRQSARLLRLTTDVDLDQDRQLPPRPVLAEKKLEAIRDLGSVDGVDHVEDLERGTSLIALERSYQVPPRSGDVRFLGDCLLNPVLAEVQGAGCHRLLHHLGRKGLANRYESDRLGITPARLCGSGDSLQYLLESFGDC